MEGLDALLREIRRIFTAGSTETALAWLLVAMIGGLLAGLVVSRRRRGRHNDVEYLFLASAAATRKAREISEIEAFARKASATAEDLKARVRRLRTGHFLQVKVYIDHSNFIRTWTQIVHSRDRPLEHDVDWARLPQVLLEETGDWLSSARKAPQALVYRGTNVYGTLFEESYFKLLETMLRLEQTAPDKLPLPIRLRKETIDRWREENEAHKIELMRTIQGEIGYQTVPILRRTPREDQIFSSNFTSGGIPIAPEKMLDTHMATDLIGDATFDVYDIALILSEDSDFVPAVDFVQEMRNKQVIHVGFGGHMNDLRAKCRYRIDLGRERLFRRVQRAGGADSAKPPAAADGNGGNNRSPASGKRPGG
ncbi:MAG: NYN domain-containing protein [Hyphomicrobiaceae bacterium]|nr:MAG: NYN domain-containing protein [Hyphomicrobiaceae bacterium]